MIQVKNLSKKYGNFCAVDNISFDIKDGEVIGLLGPNGAGKSTTMNMITGFIEPSEGEIIVNGYDVLKKPKKAKREIGYMPENVPLYMELTVKEFVSYMAELKMVKSADRKKHVEDILQKIGLKEVENKLIRNLSRGYKQRVSMAGALAGDPKVLILDEPTVGLDPKQITEIRNLIKSLGKNHTVILSSHILSEVSQICERVIIINHGKIVAIDTPSSLEAKVQDEQKIFVTVEDKESKMENIKEKLEDAKSVELVRDNEDGTKQYLITSPTDVDLRKKIFEVLPKESITIFELKKGESTLEDAFLKLINTDSEEEKVNTEDENNNLEDKTTSEDDDIKSEKVDVVPEEENIEKSDENKGGDK